MGKERRAIANLYEAIDHLTSLQEYLTDYGTVKDLTTINEILRKLYYFDEEWTII